MNGCFFVSISYKIIPRAQISTFAVGYCPLQTSGALYAGVVFNPFDVR